MAARLLLAEDEEDVLITLAAVLRQVGLFDCLTKQSNLDQLKQAIIRGLGKRPREEAIVQAQRAEAARANAEQHARQAMLRADVSAALAEQGPLGEILNRCAEALVK